MHNILGTAQPMKVWLKSLDLDHSHKAIEYLYMTHSGYMERNGSHYSKHILGHDVRLVCCERSTGQTS